MTSSRVATPAAVDAEIARNRTADVTITLLNQDGTPAAGQEVVLAQQTHQFLFGTTGSKLLNLANDQASDAEKDLLLRHAQNLLNLFNFVTLPFYWGRFEPKRGEPDTRRLKKAAEWFVQRGCAVKGHPLCWHTSTAPWLLELPVQEIVQLQLQRIRRDVADFAGPIQMWDVINEVVIMPIFEKQPNGITRMAQHLGRIGMIREVFAAARQANPQAILLLNDFDVSAAYECLIEGCLEAGIKFDAIGIQSHMHQGYWGVEKTQKVLERYARYNLPLHFTESTLVSGKIMPPDIVDLNDYQVDQWPTTPQGEARQAEEVVAHYKTLLAHPAVHAITWWGLDDGGWLKAPSGLIRIDQSPKPAYDALAALIKGTWWLAPTKFLTDAAGKIRFNGFLGQYTLSCRGSVKSFLLSQKGPLALQVRIE